MIIVNDYPPNFHEIRAAFPKAGTGGVIFTYGNTIYAPNGAIVTPALKDHEELHSRRQGRDPAGWWRRYIEDTQFRYEEELLAHRAEYRFYLNTNRKIRRQQLSAIANRLASPLYGNMVNKTQAKAAIKHG